MSKKVNGWIWRIALPVITFAFGVGFAWGVMRMQVSGLDKAVTNHELRLRKVEDSYARIETKLDILIEQSKEAK